METGEKEMIVRLIGMLTDELETLKDSTPDVNERLAKASVLKNVHTFLSNYEENCKVLAKHAYEHRFDKYEREQIWKLQ